MILRLSGIWTNVKDQKNAILKISKQYDWLDQYISHKEFDYVERILNVPYE